MADESPEMPTATAGPDRKNCALFDLTLWIFKKATRTTEKIISQATSALPLSHKKLELAQRVLSTDHPQRQQHIDRVANLDMTLKLGSGLLATSVTERQAYIDNMPEYSTGSFGEYNRTCVVRFLVHVNGAFAKMREGVPDLGGDAQFENLRKLQGYFEDMPEDMLEPRTICGCK